MLEQRMRCFLEVAGCLSFTAAANRLYMTQQAVTKQIAALERDLGVQLFIRSTRSVALTPAGQSLRNDWISIHRQLNDSIRRARRIADGDQARLSVGLLSILSREHITVPLTELLFRSFPEIQFEFRLLDFIRLRNELLDGKLDLCITTSNDYGLWPHVKVDVLASRCFEVVCSAHHPLAEAEPFSLKLLSRYTHLTLPSDNLFPGGKEWARQLPAKRLEPCPDLETLRLLLEAGRGFALLTRVFDGFDSPKLCYRPIPFPEAHAELVCIRPDREDAALGPVLACIREGFSL